jgi:hypothetical protein
VFRLPIADSLRKFDELESVTKFRQVLDVPVADVRHGTDDHSRRIRRDGRFNFVELLRSPGFVWNRWHFVARKAVEILIGSH